jgi:rhodanese-related sulfurtransferase
MRYVILVKDNIQEVKKMHSFDDKIRHIHPQELLEKMATESVSVIDVREPHELKELPFKGAKNIPLNILLMFHTNLLEKDQTYYIICHHGQRSYVVTEFLQNNGYDAINVIGGVDLVN